MEFNYLVKENKMDESEAWNICESVIIHGDELARKTLLERETDP